jgi:hypothetical protein
MPIHVDDLYSDPPRIAKIAAAAMLGFVILLGAGFTLLAMLPWQTKDAATMQNQIVAGQLAQVSTLLTKTADQVSALVTNQAVMQETVRNMANQSAQMDDLRKTVEQQAIHIEGLEADQKADSSARLAHRAHLGR